MTHGAKIAKPVAEMSADEFTDWLCALPPAPGIRHVDDAKDDDAALADLAAGRCHGHEVVSEWLRTWGTPESQPFEEWLANNHD